MKIEVLKRDENIRLFDGRTATLSAVRLPDGICDVRLYQWAEDYYRDMDAQEDKDEDEEFKPMPYTGPSGSKARKKAAGKKTAAPKKVEKLPEPKPAEKTPADEEQLSLGDFLDVAGKAS